MEREVGSFRDPSGHIYYHENQIFRSVMPCAEKDFEFVRHSGLFDRLIEQKRAGFL